jgi:hypothetical protein
MNENAQNMLVKIEPALVGIEDAAGMLGISVTAFKALDRTGQFGPMPVVLGSFRRRLYSVEELRRWVIDGHCCSREKWQAIKDEKNF